VTVAPHVIDPFETEVTLAHEPRVLAFPPRGFEIPMPELLRHLAFDLVGGIPRPLGEAAEHIGGAPSQTGAGASLGGNGAGVDYRQGFYQVNPSVLAICTEIETTSARHRILELLGVGENTRVRINMTRWSDGIPASALAGERREELVRAVGSGRSLGQVRVWACESSVAEQVRRTLARQMNNAALSPQILGRQVEEPIYRPAAAERMQIDSLPAADDVVVNLLLDLLARCPVPGAVVRSARRVGSHSCRVRRKTSIVSYRYELHRAATGVVHMRRREVEAGVERPGLVRTFNVAGLAGAARLRLRDAGGRVSAEYAGTPEAVAGIRGRLKEILGGRV
jgi:hypothetical protein